MNFVLKTLVSAMLSLTLVACVSMPTGETEHVEVKEEASAMKSKIITEYEDMSSVGPVEAVVYQIDLESNDLLGLVGKTVYFSSPSATLLDVLREISHQLNIGLLINVSDKAVAKEIRGININVPLPQILTALEAYADVDISYKSNTLFVGEKITVQGMFSHLEGEGTAALSSMQKHLTGLLGKEASVMIDTMTGAFSITGTPNLIRRSKTLIENIINESTSSALVRLHIYKINNTRVKEFGMNVSSLIDDVVTLSAGGAVSSTSPTKGVIEKTWGKDGDAARYSIAASISALEQAGIVRSVATPSVTLFNGINSTLTSTRVVGAWIPGEIQQRSEYIDGQNIITYNENRPIFEGEDVGSILELRPRVDLKNKQIHLNINYSESDVYDTTTTTWNREKNNSIELSKPLKRENKIQTRVILQNDRYGVISGNRQTEMNMSGQGLPSGWFGGETMGNESTNTKFNDTLIIARAYFPSFFRVVTITKFE